MWGDETVLKLMMVVSLLGKFTENHGVVNLRWVAFMIRKISLPKVVKNQLLHRVVVQLI